ncbi:MULTISPECIES: hypothetical protein [Fusobacterium]|jgi:hypothetical protein|nr:hypothetical protein [Fusobacterium sp.]MBS5790623.1 hypothetical protein [Fusobacterium sp.]
MKKDERAYEEFLKWKNEQFKKEMGIVDEGDIVSEDDLVYDHEEQEE